jgi:NAD(P)-dependent dehydrogenase (short-subunit alcohol dehydrogenase family)
VILAGKVVLITGGTSGIGLSIARRFAAEGAAVVVAANDEDAVGRTVNELRTAGSPAAGWFVDVRDADRVGELVERTVGCFGRLDIAVASAGVGDGASAGLDEQAQWRLIIDVNLGGVYHLARRAERAMESGSSIILIASQLGLVGARDCPAYCASKGGVVNLTRALALDYAPRGIRVNCICPGAIDTPMLEASFSLTGDRQRARADHIARHPLGRIGRPEEIASTALFLASEDASFVTGAILPVDGGYLAQ